MIVVSVICNLILYLFIYLKWRKDCKEIGRDKLAVSLEERLSAAFIFITLPFLCALLKG